MKLLTTVLFLFCFTAALAQNDRLKDYNTIMWPQAHITISLNKKYDVLAEYQWRRTDGFKNWQQSLLRAALQYKINSQVSIAAGYGWIETFTYGDYPIAANGTFPEHRLHEQIVLKNNFSKLSITQRLRIEQRWLGRREAAIERKIESWLFSHRFRYLLRLQHPITKSGNFYAAAADELFINAGKNAGVNLLDQNRLMFLIGSRINDKVNLEAGYLSQTVIQGRRINDRTIVQDNEGLLLSLVFNL
jgi:hypothetical protein